MTEDAKKIWYEATKEISKNHELVLSPNQSWVIDHDIKHLGFECARYKFAAKILENKKSAKLLELGFNHGMYTKFFLQIVKCAQIVGVDFDSAQVEYARKNFSADNISFVEDDFLGKDYRSLLKQGGFDAVVSLDVIEHISKDDEDRFLETVSVNLNQDGVAVIGTPNITMNDYTNDSNKIGHVNLFDQKRLHELFSRKFQNVFIFGMNDEIVHTGFYPMCCYIFAFCAGKKF